MRARWIFLIVSAIALIAAVGANVVRKPRRTPELRGYALARDLGCFACHGPDATGGVPNPGSEERQVPAWDGGNAMMYVNNEEEIREWIERGSIERFESNALARWFIGRQVIDMPAYKDVLTDTEMDAIITYIEWLQD